MPKNKRANRSTQSSANAFLRRPAVQIGILAVVALVIYILVASAGGGIGGDGLASNISVDEAYAIYQQGDAFFLDVRELSEWNEFHAPGATLISLGELASRLNEVSRDRPVVVVCRSGNRSQQGRDILLQAGFTDVTSMDGGLNEWRSKGYPIEP
ncbi:MAG: rhodanese-like domain-containing protein [Chloroflexi bacterium]|nr:rhodanese-like domain-containing protein [Chloroflexota bacterium]